MYREFLQTLQKFSFAPKVPNCSHFIFHFFPLIIDFFSKIPVILFLFLSMLTNKNLQTSVPYDFTNFFQKNFCSKEHLCFLQINRRELSFSVQSWIFFNIFGRILPKQDIKNITIQVYPVVIFHKNVRKNFSEIISMYGVV